MAVVVASMMAVVVLAKELCWYQKCHVDHNCCCDFGTTETTVAVSCGTSKQAWNYERIVSLLARILILRMVHIDPEWVAPRAQQLSTCANTR